MDLAQLNELSHRRLNPLTGDWVLVSPHRAERPWQGRVEKVPASVLPHYDPDCYLCPGNERAGGIRNPRYQSTFVFTNDFAALRPDVHGVRFADASGILCAESESGACRVVCFSPRHDLTLARMSEGEIIQVVNVWAREYADLGAQSDIHYVQIFENRGEMMGCSNPHPHGQIWANHTIPNEPRKEQEFQLAHLRRHSTCLLCDYLDLERNSGDRTVCENEFYLAVVPFWATWPFEILLLSRIHGRDLVSLDPAGRAALANILKQITTRYDNLFEISFPYSMGIHQAPTDGGDHPEWHLHAHFYPPLLRSATIRKFMVGYEMLGSPQRDITPESAAARLRKLCSTHYLDH